MFALACALGAVGPAPAQEAGNVVDPPAALVLDGIPPIPRRVAEATARYLDFRPRGLVDWHPVRRELLIATRSGDTTQLHRVGRPGETPALVTRGPEPVRFARFEPRQGQYAIAMRDQGGNEASQLYRLDPVDGSMRLLTNPDERHSSLAWSGDGRQFVYASVPLDRTGRREQFNTVLHVVDADDLAKRRQVAELPGGGWFDFDWSPDGTRLLAVNYKSDSESEIWEIDIADGSRRRLLPAGDRDRVASYSDPAWARDGRRFYVITDLHGEFRQAALYDPQDGGFRYLAPALGWNVDAMAFSPDRRRLALAVNEGGSTRIRLYDPDTFGELPGPRLPNGVASGLRWRPDGSELGFALSSAGSPGEVHSFIPASGTLVRWTLSGSPASGTGPASSAGSLGAGGGSTNAFSEPELVRWTSFDGREITGYLHRPSPRFPAPHPVLIDIHGGPSVQHRAGFIGRWNYLPDELGVAILYPNVRGSDGFGKTFLGLDDTWRREDSVKDIGALLDWIATRKEFDPKRVAVAGGSYGGYMSLASAAYYSSRLAGAIDIVGISNFVTFLQRTESYRRDLRRVEYGDERDPAMREFLERISPLNLADKIRIPLFVVHGRNDPRVPWQEADQIASRVKRNGVPVWYMMAENEGHGFARKANADYLFFSIIRFLETTLLGAR